MLFRSLKDDDGTVVTAIGNSGLNTQYWRLLAPDGMVYYFGYRDTMTAAMSPTTSSTWRVPVAANHSGEPGYASTFAASFQSQPWRWNVDYVVSPTQHTMLFNYDTEINAYLKQGTTRVNYDRGGVLTSINYGYEKGTESTAIAPSQVTFSKEERCDTTVPSGCNTTNPAAFPDVPMDAECDSYVCGLGNGGNPKSSPTFFTRWRVQNIRTWVKNIANTSWIVVDRWDLGYSFLKPTDGSAVSMWLSTITHTGSAGGANVTLPPVTLSPTMMTSSITGAAMSRPRLTMITSETGSQTVVTYSTPECTSSTVPTASITSNTTRCMPAYYSNGSSTPVLQWFNKYVVTSVKVHDVVPLGYGVSALGVTQDIITTYIYSGGAAWRFNDSPIIPTAYRTWSIWRGYQTVTTKTGTGTEQQTTVDTFFRGMNGAVTSVSLTDSRGWGTFPDYDWLAGFLLETQVLTTTGAVDSTKIMYPWASETANSGRLVAHMTGVSTTTTLELSSGFVRLVRESVMTRDTYGQPTMVEFIGDQPTMCVRTAYAIRSSGSNSPISRVSETSTMPKYCNTAVSEAGAVAWSRYYYDGSNTLGSLSKGLLTRVDELTGSTTRAWATTSKATYDTWGRAVTSTDALGRVTNTTYTHSASGLLSAIATTSPDPDGTGPATPLTTTVTYNPRTGKPTTIVEPGGQFTEFYRDGLDRVTALYLPGSSSMPAELYTYTIESNHTVSVMTQTRGADGVYIPSVTIYDSLLRVRQTQTMDGYGSRRDIVDTNYNSTGQAVLTDEYAVSTGFGSTAQYLSPNARGSIYRSHRLAYDYAGRVTSDSLYSLEVFQWATSTAYCGDRIAVTPPQGGTPVTTVTDFFGRTTEVIQHLGTTTAAMGVTTTYAYDTVGNLVKVTDAKGNVWQYTWDLQGNQISVTDPDRGLTEVVYDLVGNLVKTTDARGVVVNHIYDALNRETKTTSSTGASLTATVYDTVMKGQVTSQTRWNWGGQFTTRVDTYDTAARPTKTTTIIPTISGIVDAALAGNYSTTYTYKADGSLATESLPAVGPLAAETLTYGYASTTGLPDTMTGVVNSVTTKYVASTQYSDGLFVGFTATLPTNNTLEILKPRELATLRVSQIAARGPTLQHDGTLFLTYDPAGNVVEAYDMWPGFTTQMQCFTYDYQQQLVEAWTPIVGGGGCTVAPTQAGLSIAARSYWQSWTIDTIGRVTSQTDRTITTSSSTTYTYPTTGASAVRPHAVTTAVKTGSSTGSGSYTYDAAGNMTSRVNQNWTQQTNTWDDTGNLLQVSVSGTTVAKMAYDAVGNRLARQQGGATTIYVGGAEVTLTGSSLSAIRYYTHHGEVVALRTGNTTGSVSTIVTDWLGTPHYQISHATSEPSVRWQTPYGQTLGYTGSGWVGDHGLVNGMMDTTGTTRIGARDYDPLLGGFITTDPIRGDGPRGLNPYAYGFRSPMSVSDPSGKKPLADGDYEYRSDGKGGWNLYTKPTAQTPAKLVLSEPRKPAPQPLPKTVVPGGTAKEPANPKGVVVNTIVKLANPATAGGETQLWGLTAVMTFWEIASGGTCYWYNTLLVCFGGSTPTGGSGTTYGYVFISREKDPETRELIDPRDLLSRDSQQYYKLIAHEMAHVTQWQALGLTMGPLYGLAAIPDLFSGKDRGCLNVFEIGAGLQQGRYRC